jgi:hypothetical protein
METYTNDIKLKSRNNSDKEINEQGNNLIDLCIETKLRILNGRIDGDSLGYRTYYSPRGSSTVDYIICSEYILHDFVFFNMSFHQMNYLTIALYGLVLTVIL